MIRTDKEFLISLKNEMLTQDNVGQASPRFWVIMQEVKEYRVEDDEDGICIFDTVCCNSDFEGQFEELEKWLSELENVTDLNYTSFYGFEFLYDGEECTITDVADLKEFLEDNGFDEYEIIKYRTRQEIVSNTLFLTLRECKEHLKLNSHHYNNSAHPYAMTAWRSPQVERLYKIIENTKWENI